MIKKTPLYENHVAHGGKMVEFAGYFLPVQYQSGIIAEHNAVRTNVGMFDVSHMGEFLIEGKDAASCVYNLVSADTSTLADGQVKYTLMLNEQGGVVDDLLVYRMSGEKFLLVVNASNCEKDAAWVEKHLTGECTFKNILKYSKIIYILTNSVTPDTTTSSNCIIHYLHVCYILSFLY